jgi:hypothetical protein
MEGMDGMHVGRRLRLTNDDDPTSLSPRERTVMVIREGLSIGEQPAVYACVDPPLVFGQRIDRVVLSSRTHGASITDLLDRCEHQPCRVFVSRYVGQSVVPPDRLWRQDLYVLVRARCRRARLTIAGAAR